MWNRTIVVNFLFWMCKQASMKSILTILLHQNAFLHVSPTRFFMESESAIERLIAWDKSP